MRFGRPCKVERLPTTEGPRLCLFESALCQCEWHASVEYPILEYRTNEFHSIAPHQFFQDAASVKAHDIVQNSMLPHSSEKREVCVLGYVQWVGMWFCKSAWAEKKVYSGKKNLFLPVLSLIPRVSQPAEPTIGSLKTPFLDGGDGGFANILTAVAHNHEFLWNNWIHSSILRSPLPLLSCSRRNPRSDAPVDESSCSHTS